jgi:hypothetical protein
MQIRQADVLNYGWFCDRPMQVPTRSGVHGIPSTDENPLPGGLAPPDEDAAGGIGAPTGALPLTHTPLNRVATVPYGQPSATAGAATANDPKTIAAAQPPTRIPGFTVTSLRVASIIHVATTL